MPRPKSAVPAYSLHRPFGQACVYIDRQRIYLGRYGTPESKAKYSAIIAGRAAESSSPPVATSPAEPRPLTINELCLKFATEVLPKYRTADGAPNAEQACFKGVIKILRRLFGETPAADFGPVKLRLVRSEMVATGWARKHINKQVSRLRAIFKFAVSWALVPATMLEGCRHCWTVRGPAVLFESSWPISRFHNVDRTKSSCDPTASPTRPTPHSITSMPW